MTMADRIVVMRDGYVEQIGSPLELYERPANLFVAGFVGSPDMNFIKERSALRDHSNSLPMEAQAAGSGNVSMARGKEVIYGIRPDRLANQGETSAKVR